MAVMAGCGSAARTVGAAAPYSPVIPAQAGTQALCGEPLGSRLRGNDGNMPGRSVS